MEDKCATCQKPMTGTINLFGKDILIKNYICAFNDEEYTMKPAPPTLQVSIIPTEVCGCNCSFCSAHDSMKGRSLDIGKLSKVLQGLKEHQAVRGFSITGGEPFTDVERLDEIISLIFEIFGTNMEISINTNGSGISNIHKIKELSHVDAIHISRHHYDEDINASIFKGKVPGNQELKEVISSISYKDIFVFNCLLQKDFIGNKDEVCRFLDYAIEMEVPNTGFVSVMGVNDYARSQVVSYRDIMDRNDPRFLFTKRFTDYDRCSCQDGVYASHKGGITEFYFRETRFGNCDYVRGLVYGADDHLRTGYDGEVII